MSQNSAELPYSYNLLPENSQSGGILVNWWRPMKMMMVLSSGLVAIILVVTLLIGGVTPELSSSDGSEDSFRELLGMSSYLRTTKMLTWQRSAFHFQPENNWMNDPNGPMFYKGWYHLFYQYNPYDAVWGNITWGHAVSRDLINWSHLPIAMTGDHWYDVNGVWTGSATILPNEQIVMIYTGITNETMQVQNVAHPANLSDPLLTEWVKYSGNPVLVPPPGILFDEFRDPSTAWRTPEDKWRITIGSMVNKTGISLVYDTEDFISYELLDGLLHSVPGTGLRYDYGTFYASKTFYDQNKGRRVLWSWIKETDSQIVDVKKGWASLLGIPRTILFDKQTGSNIIQWPIEEVESLRFNGREFEKVEVEAGSVVPLHVDSADQLDITAEFEIDKEALERVSGGDVVYNCSTSGGAAERGALGPFGLLVLAHKNFTEQTPVYFYVAKGIDGKLKTFICQDQTRSSEATDVDKAIYGCIVPVLKGEKLSVRILVDHSIVETFAQGGRTCITSRVYPTRAIYGDAQLFLFNNATVATITASLNIWQMNNAVIQSYPDPQPTNM